MNTYSLSFIAKELEALIEEVFADKFSAFLYFPLNLDFQLTLPLLHLLYFSIQVLLSLLMHCHRHALFFILGSGLS
jgi:hypothetical protein